MLEIVNNHHYTALLFVRLPPTPTPAHLFYYYIAVYIEIKCQVFYMCYLLIL